MQLGLGSTFDEASYGCGLYTIIHKQLFTIMPLSDMQLLLMGHGYQVVKTKLHLSHDCHVRYLLVPMRYVNDGNACV